MKEEDYFCNEWDCEYRKNEKYKNKKCCDLAWDYNAPCMSNDFYTQDN